jgi:MFS family permease
MGYDTSGDAVVGRRWLILAVLFLARTTIGFQFQSIGTLSPVLLAALRIDYTQLGLLIGSYLLPGVVIAYPGGLLGQRFGDKRVALVGLALMLLGGVLTSISDDYAPFLVGRLVSGAGAVLLNVLLNKMATDWFAGREIGTALAILAASWPIGISLSLVSLPWFAAAISVAAALAAAPVMAAMAIALVAIGYPGRAGPAAALSSAASARAGLSAREFGLVSLAGGIWAVFNVGYILVVSFAPSLLVARGMSATAAALATSLATWIIVVTIPLGGIVTDRTGRSTALMSASFAVFGLATMLMPRAPTPVLIAFIGAVAGLPAGAILALPAEVLRPATRGAGMGVFFTWYYIAMALLPPLAGRARDVTGHPGAPLVIAGGLEISAIAILGLFRLFQRRCRLPP